MEDTGYAPLGGGSGARVMVTSGTLRPGDRAQAMSKGFVIADSLRIIYLREGGKGVDAAGTGSLCEVFIAFGHLARGDVIVTHALRSGSEIAAPAGVPPGEAERVVDL